MNAPKHREQNRWSLRQALAALRMSARTVAVPSIIWVAGAFYPGLNLNVDLVRAMAAIGEATTGIDLPGTSNTGALVSLFAPTYLAGVLRDLGVLDLFLMGLLSLPILLFLARFIVGLAKISDPAIWHAEGRELPHVVESGLISSADLMKPKPPRLMAAWRAGRGLGLKALGLWGMLLGMVVVASLVLIGPVLLIMQKVFDMENLSALVQGLLVPPLALLFAYAVVLMVINQLALHSLAHNKRGVSSALTHAWRLVRASPRSALRATGVDCVLAAFVLAMALGIRHVLLLAGADDWSAGLLLFPLYAFAGVTRAGYWARVYRALGGMSSADHVPGL